MADDPYIRFEVSGTRCFNGKGYSEEHCSQSFDTFDEANAHRLKDHAAPEMATIYKQTTEEVTSGDTESRAPDGQPYLPSSVQAILNEYDEEVIEELMNGGRTREEAEARLREIMG